MEDLRHKYPTYSSELLDLAAVPIEDWHKAKYLAVNASENELIDEIIDLKRKLNTMVRMLVDVDVTLDFVSYRADYELFKYLRSLGYGGDEVPE
jgi:hypothetical protein